MIVGSERVRQDSDIRAFVFICCALWGICLSSVIKVESWGDGMGTVSSSIPDSTESQMMDTVIEQSTTVGFRQVHNEAEGAHLPRLEGSFGSVDPPSILSAADRDPGFSSDSAFAASHGRAEDCLKLEPGSWVEVSDALPLKEPGGGVVGNFVKNEREPGLISSDFSRTSPELMNAGALCLEPCSSAAPLACKIEPGAWAPHRPLPVALRADTSGQLGLPAPDGVHSPGFIQRTPALFTPFSSVHTQRVCRICGDEASGCHYGVVTCGSCKVFFKRAVEGHRNYMCVGRNDCTVDKIRRKNCPACRLRKCKQAGMMLGGRRFKRYGAVKPVVLDSSMMFQGHSLAPMPCMPTLQQLHLLPQLLNILEGIEPEMVYSGYDSSQLDLPHLLLNSLNQLCERQLLFIVKWSKNLPGFRRLHNKDQMTLIQHSWMNLMVFSLGWRFFQNVTLDYLYFTPDLILSQDRMRQTPIYELCQTMQLITQEFAKLQVTKEEFLCMKALMLLNTVPLEGFISQIQFDEMRRHYIRELTRAIRLKKIGLVESYQRFYHLTKLMDSMHETNKLFGAMRVEFPEMMSEVNASQLPNVLAGMVRPLFFHSK